MLKHKTNTATNSRHRPYLIHIARGKYLMASTKLETVVMIPLKDIHADVEWNLRSGDSTISNEGDEAETDNQFKELVVSILASGGVNKDAVKVRPKGNNGKFSLVTGFRRFAAIQQIANDQKNKEPVIKAIVEELDELAARQENVRENVARASCKGPDLAWALKDIKDKFKLKGIDASDMAISDSIGMNQSYGNKLLRIMEKVIPKLTKAWRESPLPLSVQDMIKVSQVDKDNQQKEYDSLQKKKTPKTGRDKTKAYVDGMVKKAERMGTIIGNLEREGLINADALSFDDHLEYLGIKLKKETTPKQKETISGAADKAYNAALVAQVEPEQEEE